MVKKSDNDRLDLESGDFWSFKLQNTVPANTPIRSVKVYIEHHEEEGISPNSVVFQVGGGSLTQPSTLGSQTVPVLSGESKEGRVEWDVTTAINTAAKVNDLKVIIRNAGTNGKKIKIDRVYVVVN